jgi:hypothetical protein
MPTTRWLTSLMPKRERTSGNREAAETDRLERETAGLQNRHSEPRRESTTRPLGLLGPG